MKPMKFLAVLFLVAFCVTSGNSQLTYGFKKSKYFKQFLQTDLAVELSGDPAFDEALRASVESVWAGKKKIVFMDAQEIQELKSKESNFSVLGTISITKSLDGYEVSNQSGFGVYIPNTKTTFGAYLYSVLAFVPFQCYTTGGGSGKNEGECNYPVTVKHKIELINHMIFQILETVEENRRRGFAPPMFSSQFNFAHQKQRELLMDQKTLLVNTADLTSKFTEEKVRKIYKHNIEFVKPEKFEQLLTEGSDKYLVLLSSNGVSKYLSIMDLDSKELLAIQYGVGSIGRNSEASEMSKKQFKKLKKKRLISKLAKRRVFLAAFLGLTLLGNV